ncbi:hypothetical protein ES703_84003 [subsurface metagenome]
MRQFLVALRYDLVLADPRAASWAPGHGVESLVYPAPLVEALEDCPDHVVVLIGEREVATTHLP